MSEWIKKEETLVKAIAKEISEIYGKYWDIEIDFIEGNVEEGYTLRIHISRHKKLEKEMKKRGR